MVWYFEQNAYYRSGHSIRVSVNYVELKIKLFTIDSMFRWGVEVILKWVEALPFTIVKKNLKLWA